MSDRGVPKWLIVNADDFGASAGVNRGIIEAHARGIVTSASFMVTGRAAAEAVELARDHPDLALGLHWDVGGEDERDFDLRDHAAVRDEFRRQLECFHDMLGRPPTHLDSHRHAHREIRKLFQELVEPLGVPLRAMPAHVDAGTYRTPNQRLTTDLRLSNERTHPRNRADRCDARQARR